MISKGEQKSKKVILDDCERVYSIVVDVVVKAHDGFWNHSSKRKTVLLREVEVVRGKKLLDACYLLNERDHSFVLPSLHGQGYASLLRQWKVAL